MAPLAVKVALADVQTELLLAVKVKVGKGFTFIVNVLLFLQPLASVAFTV